MATHAPGGTDQRPPTSPYCLSIPRLGDLARGVEVPTQDEESHLATRCRRCWRLYQRALEILQEQMEGQAGGPGASERPGSPRSHPKLQNTPPRV